MAAAPKVVYEQDGVFIHLCSERIGEQDTLPGILRLIDKGTGAVVDWSPVDDSLDLSNIFCAGKDSSSVVEWSQCPKEKSSRSTMRQNSCEAEWDMVNTVTFKKKPFINGDDDSTYNMNKRSKWAFSFNLTDLKSIKKNSEGMGWSFMVFCLWDDTFLPALHFHHGGSTILLQCLKRYVLLSESSHDDRVLLVAYNSKALSQSFENLFEENAVGLVQKFKKDPYTTTLGGFSKVTNYLMYAFRGYDVTSQQRPASEIDLTESISGLEINHQEEPGFEVITRIDLGTRPEIQRGEPVSIERWSQCMDAEGKVLDPDNVKKMIFKGGLCHAVRRLTWKFLLNYFPWDSSKEDRRLLAKRKTDEYFRMKLQWKSVSKEQEKRNTRLKDYKSLIEKDVNRTDRTNPFYEGHENPGLILLHDILMTYCMYDFDLGYVQGMSDLLSPILYVMENEVDAFWCFVAFIEQMHCNFEEQMQGMKTELSQLSTLLKLLDLGFWNYLESQESGYLYFCFRWLLIRFKREFSFQDTLRLWEVMWTGLPCQNFHLLICCAILDSEKQKIMEDHYGFNEILKHINELSLKLDVEEVLCKAEAIYCQMMKCKDLPQAVGEILGLKDSTVITPDLEISASDTGVPKNSWRANHSDFAVASFTQTNENLAEHTDAAQNGHKTTAVD
ncbi:TBC1 domain family member 15 [Stegostoma tigrinum]|uniref:TBC1 domain family member 15 n=1 Tax=Stegostoma tigrinum TaxID=3053191 RepID=UPI00202B44FF|nr:TBC1 domain family member 15 [Stegostoma tigrinum]